VKESSLRIKRPRLAPGPKALNLNRQPQRKSTTRKESTSAELERAATALRARYLDQFRKKRDSDAKYFYKSMAIFPARFRVMTLCKFSPPYRSKPEYDQVDLEATTDLRDYLGEYLDSFCSVLPEFVSSFIDNLSRIRHDINWIDGQANKIFSHLDSEYAPWAQFACDGEWAKNRWNAPGWLDKWPEKLPPDVALCAARGGRLDGARTTIVLEAIKNQIITALEKAQKGALDNLRVRLAQETETARGAAKATTRIMGRRDQSEQDPRAALTEREEKILEVIQRGAVGLLYCRELHIQGIRPLRSGVWEDCPAGTYPAAYMLGDSWRHRIQDEKSKIKRKAKLAKTLASE
jgi:hypothetical protein